MAAASPDENEDIIVVGKVADDQRAVWDRWPGHPANYEQQAGEVFISDMRPYNVDRTSPGIAQKLGEKALREISPRMADQRMADYDQGQKEKQAVREAALESQRGNAVLVPPATPVVPLATAQTAPVPTATTPASEQHDGDDGGDGGDGEEESGQQTGGTGTLARPRARRTSTETPPER